MYKTQKEQLLKSYAVGYDTTNIKGSQFHPANKSEFDCSKPFLCKGIDGSNPAARNLGNHFSIFQITIIILNEKGLIPHSSKKLQVIKNGWI